MYLPSARPVYGCGLVQGCQSGSVPLGASLRDRMHSKPPRGLAPPWVLKKKVTSLWGGWVRKVRRRVGQGRGGGLR